MNNANLRKLNSNWTLVRIKLLSACVSINVNMALNSNNFSEKVYTLHSFSLFYSLNSKKNTFTWGTSQKTKHLAFFFLILPNFSLNFKLFDSNLISSDLILEQLPFFTGQ